MVVTENVSKIVSLCDKMGDDYLTIPKNSLKYIFLGDAFGNVSVPPEE